MTISVAHARASTIDRKAAGLVLVSNRGPVEHYIDDLGRIRQRAAGGGVAVALGDVARTEPVTWIAATSTFPDRVLALQGDPIPLTGDGELRLVDVPETENAAFYGSFCNPILWFVQHSASGLLHRRDLHAEASESWRTGYVPVNRRFAEAIVAEIDRAAGNVQVMLHDYHLYLAPKLVRALRPEILLQQFVHIPWPEPMQWLALPDEIVREVCSGLLANDSVAFQTVDCAENFMATCRAYLGAGVDVCEHRNEVWSGSHSTHVWSNPISVDTAQLQIVSECQEVLAHKRRLTAKAAEQTIVRVDRLDPSKNVLRGFEAYELLLRRRPELRGGVRFLAFLVPSRAGISEYDSYARAVFAAIQRINDKYGTPEWTPITMFYENNRAQALAALALYDVLLVNPIADGMNLVSKEGAVLNERDGMLVLSVTAGSHRELQSGAIGVDPFDVSGTARALERALEMPAVERAERALRLRGATQAHQIGDWLAYLRRDLAIQEYVRAAGSARYA